MAELRARTGLGGDCGRCLKSAVRLLRGAAGEDVPPRAAHGIPYVAGGLSATVPVAMPQAGRRAQIV